MARPSLWFVVPAHRRVELARVCLRQLRRTCEALAGEGVDASAVVIACDENLDTARELGFATIERANQPLGARMNDGYEFAAYSKVDFVVPFGSDDWIDWRLLVELPASDAIRCHRLSAAVDASCSRMVRLRIPYAGGDGVRVLPVRLFSRLGWRPVDEQRRRAIDASTLARLRGAWPKLRLDYRDLHALQIVDFKSPREQLTSYDALAAEYAVGAEDTDPFGALAEHYPTAAVDEMRALHRVRVAA